MRKRIMLAAAAAASLVMLTGCLAQTYPLTEKEQDIIAEYAAAVLLRHDEDYTQALLSPAPTPTLEPTPSPMPTPVPEGTGNKGGNAGKGDGAQVTANASLGEVFGLEGLSVEYDGYELFSAIEESGGYVVRAEKGKMLVKVSFTLTNTAGIEQEFAFAAQDISYRLDCGEKSLLQPKITGIEGELLFMKVGLAAGESCGGCVIFEVLEKEEFAGGRVVISRGDAYTSITALDQ